MVSDHRPAGIGGPISVENVIMASWIVGIHVACISVFWVGASWVSVLSMLALWQFGIFSVGAGYHRYFAHKSYKTSRVFQTIMAVLSVLTIQGGVRKWSQDHRHHHRYSDMPEDVHSPFYPNFFWSHMGWVINLRHRELNKAAVKDLDRQPELVWVDRLMILIIVAFVALLYVVGQALGPAYGTSGAQMVVWGFVIRTVLLWHTTWTINSVVHKAGKRRFPTRDHSRNNWAVALITGGEGYHNNHHAYPSLACQGMFWWEYDSTFWTLKLLSKLGVVRDLKVPDAELLAVARSLSRMQRQGWRVLKTSDSDSSRGEIRARLNELVRATTDRLNELRTDVSRKKEQLQESARGGVLAAQEFASRYGELRQSFMDQIREIELSFGLACRQAATT